MAADRNTRLIVLAVVLGGIVCAAAIYLAAPARPGRSLVPLPAAPSPAATMPAPPAALVAADPSTSNPTPPRVDSSQGLLPWERQVMQILDGQSLPSGKARALFALLHTLPPDALGTTTERALECVSDADYRSTARPVMIDPHTHGAVLSVLFGDLMERPDAIALPTLLDIARNPDHPFAPNAHDNLAHALGQDFQSNWDVWNTAIQQRLRGP